MLSGWEGNHGPGGKSNLLPGSQPCHLQANCIVTMISSNTCYSRYETLFTFLLRGREEGPAANPGPRLLPSRDITQEAVA